MSLLERDVCLMWRCQPGAVYSICCIMPCMCFHHICVYTYMYVEHHSFIACQLKVVYIHVASVECTVRASYYLHNALPSSFIMYHYCRCTYMYGIHMLPTYVLVVAQLLGLVRSLYMYHCEPVPNEQVYNTCRATCTCTHRLT